MTDASRPQALREAGKKPTKEQMAGIPAGLWEKCPKCRAMLYVKELERDLRVCHSCQYHFAIPTLERLAILADDGSFTELDANMLPVNPLGFPGYEEKLTRGRQKSGLEEGFIYGDATVSTISIVLGIANFAQMGASMGSVVGEKVTRALERGVAHQRPVVFSCTSGGARMQEGMISLMQMAKTAAACARLKASGIPYITILTNPTTGGVWASFASLGDIILAEPGAFIALTGPRVLEQNLKVKLPSGTCSSEFLLAHGMIDMVVHRRDLRTTVSKLLSFLSPVPTNLPPANDESVPAPV